MTTETTNTVLGLPFLENLLFAPQAVCLAQCWVPDFKRDPDKLTLRVTEQAGKKMKNCTKREAVEGTGEIC